MQYLYNVIAHPHSTVAGVTGGAALWAIGSYVLDQAGCHFDGVNWSGVLTFAVSAIWGGIANPTREKG